jgi:hypothetical protein
LAKSVYSMKMDLVTNVDIINSVMKFIDSYKDNNNNSNNTLLKDPIAKEVKEAKEEQETTTTTTTDKVF